MVRYKDTAGVDDLYNLHGGKGRVHFHHLLFENQGEFMGHGGVYSKIEVERGGAIGYHQHVNEFEVYYILEGKGLFNDNGVEVPMEAGDISICKDGDYHGIKNTGDSELVMMCLVLNS